MKIEIDTDRIKTRISEKAMLAFRKNANTARDREVTRRSKKTT